MTARLQSASESFVLSPKLAFDTRPPGITVPDAVVEFLNQFTGNETYIQETVGGCIPIETTGQLQRKTTFVWTGPTFAPPLPSETIAALQFRGKFSGATWVPADVVDGFNCATPDNFTPANIAIDSWTAGTPASVGFGRFVYPQLVTFHYLRATSGPAAGQRTHLTRIEYVTNVGRHPAAVHGITGFFPLEPVAVEEI